MSDDRDVALQEAPPDTEMLAKTGHGEALQVSNEPSALDQFRERTRYPASTRKINENSFDLLNPGARHENRQALPGPDNPDLAWQVLFTADRFFVTGDEPILISLQLWNRGEAVLPESVSLQAEAVGPGDRRAPVMLAARSDGKAKTTVFEPNKHWPEYLGRVRVGAKFSARDLKPQSGELDFFFTGKERVPAHFTGTFRDFMAGGDLLIEVGLDVHRDGIFRIDGNLFDRAGKPFGWARFEGPLAQGNAVAALRYYGLLFHDAEAQAPFTLRNLHGYR
ncbi:MAG: hypothetical protein HKO64_07145, partial [Xanthomonadales bacterium]|nr:hypothetical protein [Xanthomonadales bacterium]